jgi:glycosyltransferase involved in cell wall biosynthesis
VLDQITPLILTYNEEPNIRRTLEQLYWANDIVVVDSFSQDRTLQIISEFPQVRVIERKFEGFASQCNFGLKETEIETEWVLSLDADYIVTPELISEMSSLNPGNADGFSTRFIYCINGRQLRSGIYPRVTTLFRRKKAQFVTDGHAHRVIVDGPTRNLVSPMLHDDRKSLKDWFHSQVRYTELEARKLIDANPTDLSWPDRIRRWRVFAPAAMLFYCLVIRGGVLDGWAGFFYAFQRTVAELMLSIYLIESDLLTGEKQKVPDEPGVSLNGALVEARANHPQPRDSHT